MTTLAEFQVYDTDHQPYAWVTMPMLFWAFGILAFLAVASVGMCVAIVRRLNRVEDDHDTRIARAYLDAKKTAKDVAQLARDVAEIDEDVAALFNAAHDHPDDAEVEPKRLPVDTPTSPSLDVAGEAARRVIEETPVDEPTRQMQTVHREMGGRTFEFRE